MAKYNEKGQEIPDPTPVELPLGFRRPPSIHELIKAAVRDEMSREAESQGMETFDEADDFDVDDDEEINSPYELTEMQEEFRYAKQDASNLDKKRELEEDDGAVNDDRATKESTDVQSARVRDDRKGAGRSGEVGVASRGERGAARDGGGGVSKGRRSNRRSAEESEHGSVEDGSAVDG